MASCSNCQDANYCYYPGGAPTDHSCGNWSPSIEYKAQQYDKGYNPSYAYITYVEDYVPKRKRTNFEKIKSMSLEELADLIDSFRACSNCRRNGNNCFPHFRTEEWLKSDADD